jgi:hypothetical protein
MIAPALPPTASAKVASSCCESQPVATGSMTLIRPGRCRVGGAGSSRTLGSTRPISVTIERSAITSMA